MSIIRSQNRDILETFDAEYNASSFQFVQNVDIEGTLFQRFPLELLKKVSTDCLVIQKHKYIITPEFKAIMLCLVSLKYSQPASTKTARLMFQLSKQRNTQ